MRISHSIWLLSWFAAAMAISVGCGNDFGGDPASDASSMRDGARPDASGDGARQGDSGPLDGGGPEADADGAAHADISVPPSDSGVRTPDGSMDSGSGSDASDARDARADIADARVDIAVDSARADADVRDAGDGSIGPDGPVGPGCGNGIKEAGEECDDGNTRDFDGCSWYCADRRPCDCCVTVNNGEPLTCDKVDGDAEGGPKAGVPKAQLCGELYACVLRSRCGFDSGVLLDCYCGKDNTAADSCIADPSGRGPCIAQLEAGLEAEGATWQDRVKTVSSRMSDIFYGGGYAMQRWIFEVTACPDNCGARSEWGGVCPSDPGTPDAGDAGIDARVDRAPDISVDTSAPPDVSAPPVDVGPTDSGGAVDGATIDKDCDDCLAVVGLDPYVCGTLTGTAAGGPAAGVSKQQLCWESLDCIHRTNCHANAAYECYCGTVIDLGTCTSTTQANGACKAEFDRSLEVPPGDPGSTALNRFTEPAYAGGPVGSIATIEGTDPFWQGGCKHVCIPYTPTHGRDR